MDVVTGSTGYLGSVLVRALLRRGRRVRATARSSSDCSHLRGERVELVRADVADETSLCRAFDGAERVFHAAGFVSFGIGSRAKLYATNVDGTASVIRACEAVGVRPLLYVSSIEALDLSRPTRTIDEEAGFHPERALMEYGRTKALATLAVLQAHTRGLEAVVVCPTGYVGPYDYRLSAMGRLVVDYVRRRLPVLVEGGFDFVDVRDVAEGTIDAADRGRSGEAYILSGSYVTVADIMRALEARTGIPAPSLVLPARLALAFGKLAEVWYAACGAPPRFTASSVDLLSRGLHVSCRKAARELHYASRPFAQTLDDTLEWMRAEGILRPSGGLQEVGDDRLPSSGVVGEAGQVPGVVGEGSREQIGDGEDRE